MALSKEVVTDGPTAAVDFVAVAEPERVGGPTVAEDPAVVGPRPPQRGDLTFVWG
jgi:hypothetical protein